MYALVFIAAFSTILSAAPVYSIAAIGPENSVATGLGPDGSVSGWSTDGRGMRSAFVVESALPVFASDAMALDTAGNGMSVGNIWTPNGSRAVVWDGSTANLLDLEDSYALAVNGSGSIAGSALRNGKTTAFIQAESKTLWIGYGSWSAAYDLNNLGQAVGTFQNDRGQFRSFSWSEETGFMELGSLGGGSSWARAVNDTGVVTGSATTYSGYLHAFVYGAGLADLGTLGGTTSAGYDVNRQGSVVGYSFDRLGRSRAFLWQGGMMLDLNQLIDPQAGWTLEAAYGINDNGQIAGTGTWNGRSQAFLLSPASHASTTTNAGPESFSPAYEGGSSAPEPGTLTAVAISGAILVGLRFSRSRNS